MHFERIRDVIASALMVERGDIAPDSYLIDDLGAESIDFLDVLFRLEKEFGVKLSRGEIERRARGSMTDAEFAPDGRLSPAALERLKATMPEVPSSRFVPGLMLRELPRLMTVATFERIVTERLALAAAHPVAAAGRVAAQDVTA